jgi:putative flippase GtrA
MALAQNRLVAGVWSRLRSQVGVRFTRFAGVAVASLLTSMIALSVCDGLFHLTATWAAIVSWFCGAVVSYVLSRWAWERKGKPDVLRETIPFWVISALVVVILSLATKAGYKIAQGMGVHHGIKHVLIVEGAYFVANVVTFILRFVIFHYILFTDRTTAAQAAATGPDVPQVHGPHDSAQPQGHNASQNHGDNASQNHGAPQGHNASQNYGAPQNHGSPRL